LFDGDKPGEIAPLMIEHFGQYIPESHKKQMIEQFRHMSREQLLSFYEHCSFIEQASDISEFVDLASIRASTLIVTGEYDSILDVADVEQASQRIPHCEFKLIRGAGHFLHWERADILHTYSEFLAR
jgi:pimeloyl-ACP methyl ester carboxylesterase